MAIRNVRNFWIDCDIDARETMLSGGPVGKEGGMGVELKMRENGEAVTILKINCFALKDAFGKLVNYITVFDSEGNKVFHKEAKR